MAIINVYKPIGWTPLQCIKHLQHYFNEYKNSPMTYAGRLDPMAEGVLLLLSDDDRHQKQEYLGLEKTYEATFLLSIETDTGDMLGMPTTFGHSIPNIEMKQLETILSGEHTLPLPAYASYKVHGKPLHWWAQQNRLDEIEIPTRKMSVLDLNTISIQKKLGRDLLKNTVEHINKVKGDFRQEPIIQTWQECIKPKQTYIIISCTLSVTAGTYIRSLAVMLGKQLGTHGTLLSLKRTAVGRFIDTESLKLTIEK